MIVLLAFGVPFVIACAAACWTGYQRGYDDAAREVVSILLDAGAPLTRAHVDELRRRIGR